ncbi:MAG: hypothetical protein ACK4L7_01930 [Flavobacteriales bacterium]
MRIPTLSLALLLAPASRAQPEPRTIATDTGTVVLHYFSSGEVSTKEWRDEDDRWGRSWAYKKTGETIFDGQTRRFAGHATVRFSYYPDGAVSRVETSDAPDGGIQWYQSITTFDEAGNRTGFWEQGRDNYGPIPSLRIEPRTLPPLHSDPREPERRPAEAPDAQHCQRLFVNEVFLVNATRHAGRAKIRALQPSPALQDSEHTLAPGDTVRLGSYTMGEVFIEPSRQVSVEVRRLLRNRRKPASLGLLKTIETAVTAEHRRYYLVVMGWRK